MSFRYYDGGSDWGSDDEFDGDSAFAGTLGHTAQGLITHRPNHICTHFREKYLSGNKHANWVKDKLLDARVGDHKSIFKMELARFLIDNGFEDLCGEIEELLQDIPNYEMLNPKVLGLTYADERGRNLLVKGEFFEGGDGIKKPVLVATALDLERYQMIVGM